MNTTFMELFLDRTHFPSDAQKELFRCLRLLAEKGCGPMFDTMLEDFFNSHFDIDQTQLSVDRLASQTAVSPYTIWLLLLIHAADYTKADYARRGIREELFWETFSDLRIKAIECREIKGVWGVFVAFWYPIFYTCNIVKIGRFEYENQRYPLDCPYTCGNITVKKGDPVKSLHIPSSGEPFDGNARLESYRKAYHLFKPELGGGPLICICHSWLLYPEYRKLLDPSSNILGFMGDFDIIHRYDKEAFSDAWRIFGRDHQKPADALPENTSLQRAFKRHLLAGGQTGEGFGIMLFHGDRILNSKGAADRFSVGL